MELSIQLSRIFLDNPGGVYSIQQISRKLGLPYGTTYNRIHQLGDLGIVSILPQGKAKLCALNSTSPMTAAILGLGASQETAKFLRSGTPASNLVGKVKDFVETRFKDQLHSAILLNYEAIAALPKGELPFLEMPNSETSTAGEKEEESVGTSLDLFLVMAEENSEIQNLENSLLSAIPHQYNLRFTKMAVTPSTLLGMLQERENDAGTAAYHMLRRGLVLFGFERFFHLVLKFFGNPLFRR